jgi:hypothetical protein
LFTAQKASKIRVLLRASPRFGQAEEALSSTEHLHRLLLLVLYVVVSFCPGLRSLLSWFRLPGVRLLDENLLNMASAVKDEITPFVTADQLFEHIDSKD